jgi:hypothetical protein
MTETYFSRKQAAAFLAEIGCPVSYQQLKRWGLQNNYRRGPAFTIVRDRRVHYAETDLRAWAKQNAKRVE